jgi:transcriptional regulator with XRE-family HTH domain
VPRNTRYLHLSHEQNSVVNSALVRKEFGRVLKTERLRLGYTQSRLARESAKFTANKRFGRELIGVYERTMKLPGDVHLCAIAKALGKEPKDLLWPLLTTINGYSKDSNMAATTLELTDLGDGPGKYQDSRASSVGGCEKGCRSDHAGKRHPQPKVVRGLRGGEQRRALGLWSSSQHRRQGRFLPVESV